MNENANDDNTSLPPVLASLAPDKRRYAEILVNGKTGIRHIPLVDSTPYIKDWVSRHPQSGNPTSILLCELGKSLKRMIDVISLNKIYHRYKTEFFPKLLDSPTVLPEDKQKIKELLKKPWNGILTLGAHKAFGI